MERENCKIEGASIDVETLNPHFVFNTLNTIKGAVILQKEGVDALIDDFSVYLRYLVKTAEQKNDVELAEELKFTKAYTNIEQKRFLKLNVRYEVEEIDCCIPAFTVQKIVNEMIHKGILANSSGGTIRIHSLYDKSRYCLVIEHNGMEYPIKMPEWEREHIEVNCGGKIIEMRIREKKR